MISHSAMALSSFFKLPHGGKLCISQSSVIARGSTRELLSFPHLPAGNASTHILIYPPSRWFHDATDIIDINIYLCNFMYVYLIHDLYSFFFFIILLNFHGDEEISAKRITRQLFLHGCHFPAHLNIRRC